MEEESRNADSRTVKLADRSFRWEPRSAAPLAVSTARRKLTQLMESRMPASTRSTSSPGNGTEGPTSQRKNSYGRRRCLSRNCGMKQEPVITPGAIRAVEWGGGGLLLEAEAHEEPRLY